MERGFFPFKVNVRLFDKKSTPSMIRERILRVSRLCEVELSNATLSQCSSLVYDAMRGYRAGERKHSEIILVYKSSGDIRLEEGRKRDELAAQMLHVLVSRKRSLLQLNM